MAYVTAFEITRDSSLWWWPWVVGTLIFGLFAAIFLLLLKDDPFTRKRVRWAVVLFGCLWAALVTYKLHERRGYIQAYREGKYTVVEGRAEHYSWKGKTECFGVHGVEFCRGTGTPDQLSWPIGTVSEGLPVRVAYTEMGGFPKILRLEIWRLAR